MKSLDTNVFLRFLTRDDPVKAQACHELLRRVDRGEEPVTTCEAVVAELVYVLSSPRLYNLSRADIRARMVPLLTLKGLYLPDRRVYLQALDLYVAHPRLDFEDALLVAHMGRHKAAEIVSYDEDFDAMAGIRRVTP